MITMLDCSELNTEVSDAGIETIESDDCRKVLKDDRNTNGMLVIMQEKAIFSHKDRQKFINLFIQSISGLCQVSQLYPKTREQKALSRVTQKVRFIQLPVEKIIKKLAISEILLFNKPTNKQRVTSRVADVFKW